MSTSLATASSARFSDALSPSVGSRVEIGACGGGMLSREQQRERPALSEATLRFYSAAMSLGDLAGYREAQSRAAGCAGFVCPVEPLEDERQLVLGDADPGVGTLDPRPLLALSHGHSNPAAFRSVLHGVVQEDGDRLADAASIAENEDRVLRGCAPDRHLVLRGDPSRLHRFIGYGSKVAELEVQRGVLVATGERQEGLDQLPHILGLPPYGRHALADDLRVRKAPFFEQLGVAAYGGQGRPELVTGVGGEAPLASQGLLQTGEGLLQAGEKAVYGRGE